MRLSRIVANPAGWEIRRGRGPTDTKSGSSDLPVGRQVRAVGTSVVDANWLGSTRRASYELKFELLERERFCARDQKFRVLAGNLAWCRAKAAIF